MISASYVWSHGEYYDYGWFLPPAALWLTFRRWNELSGPVTLPRRRTVLILAALLLPWILVLRILGHADPSWRLPMSLLGLTAALTSHGLIAATRGWRASAGFGWITLLWMSALPWPSVVESGIVRHLTQSVVTAVAQVFQLFGKPVEVMGDRLRLHDLTVEGPSVERELSLFKVAGTGERRVEALRLADIFRANVVDSTLESFVFEITGTPEKIDAFAELMRPLGLVDVARTGVAALSRGHK